MKRRNLILSTAFILSMSAGCAGNTNLQMKSVAEAPTTAAIMMAVEPSADTTQEVQENSSASAQIQVKQTQTVTETAAESISIETAKFIAMKDAGISGQEAAYSSAKLDWEEGRQVYEVDFFSGGVEYEYDILASDGTILKRKQDTKWGKNLGTSLENQTENSSGGPLTIDQARQKVVEKIPGVDPASIYMKEDYDDGRLQYEGEVYYNNAKYEFELDAATGTFYDWEVETGR